MNDQINIKDKEVFVLLVMHSTKNQQYDVRPTVSEFVQYNELMKGRKLKKKKKEKRIKSYVKSEGYLPGKTCGLDDPLLRHLEQRICTE